MKKIDTLPQKFPPAPGTQLYDWSPEKMIEIGFAAPGDFLKVKETLTRIGIASSNPINDDKKFVLTQSCHLLHKRGRYYIVHFKELFYLDGRNSTLSILDIGCRNLIISLLEEWKLLRVLSDRNLIEFRAPSSAIKVVKYSEKPLYDFRSKYFVGKKNFSKHKQEDS